uniref:Carboxypeptidase A5-like isoform X5 n=1 Tax=Phascolarctos cinereus TaxID=38626 RepID=A0A6P5LNC7_PHACI|nr:carboxypeptidase A5-like isoform X5 [Phascolarctos cinereus]
MRGLLIVSLFLAATLSQKMFSGDQVLRIKAKDEKQLQVLRNLEDSEYLKVDFWQAPARPSLPMDMRVPFSNLKAVKNYLNSSGILYTVMIEDIQVLLDEERKGMTASRRLERSTSSFRYNSYHTLEEIYTWMDNFVVEHSNLVSKFMIGQTFEKRPIFVLKFSTGNRTRPAIWIDSGIHAREWITQATGVWTAMKIATDYGEEPVLTKILNHMDIFLEVVTNPDGFAYTHSMNSLARKAVEALSQVHGTEYIYGRTISTIYMANGITIDWAYEHDIKCSFSFELRDTGIYGFLLPASQIIPTAEETWQAILTITKHACDNPY